MEEKNIYNSIDQIKKTFHVRKIKSATFSNGKKVIAFNKNGEGYYWEEKDGKYFPLSSNLK